MYVGKTPGGVDGGGEAMMPGGVYGARTPGGGLGAYTTEAGPEVPPPLDVPAPPVPEEVKIAGGGEGDGEATTPGGV